MRRLSDIISEDEPRPSSFRKDQHAGGNLIQPTADDVRNGWTAETLTEYLTERAEAQRVNVFHRAPVKPKAQKSKYNPHRWRG